MAKYTVSETSAFRKDYKLAVRQRKDMGELRKVVSLLENGEKLPAKYKDHALKGQYAGNRECHIEPDWLLIYRVDEAVLLLALMRTGTHSRLFEE